jgi:hypothetical protein
VAEKIFGIFLDPRHEQLAAISRCPDDMVLGLIYGMSRFAETHRAILSCDGRLDRPFITRQSLVFWLGLNKNDQKNQAGITQVNWERSVVPEVTFPVWSAL